MVFSLTKKSSLTPFSASHLASLIISSGVLEIKDPLNCGIAQNEHLRSHPEAIFKGAIGELASLFLAKVPPCPIFVFNSTFISCLATGEMGIKLLRSRGVWAGFEFPARIFCNRVEISA